MGILENSRENFGAEIQTEIETEHEPEDALYENQKRAKSVIRNLKLFIGISIVIHLIKAVYNSQFYLLQYNHQFEFGDGFQWLMSLSLLGSWLVIIVFLIVARKFALWLKNVHQHISNKQNLKYSSNQALWSWFIPIAWWFRPFQIVNDIEQKRRAHPLFIGGEINISLWWGCFLAFFWFDRGFDFVSIFVYGLLSDLFSNLFVIKSICN